MSQQNNPRRIEAARLLRRYIDDPEAVSNTAIDKAIDLIIDAAVDAATERIMAAVTTALFTSPAASNTPTPTATWQIGDASLPCMDSDD